MSEKAGKESQYSLSRLPFAPPWWDGGRGVTCTQGLARKAQPIQDGLYHLLIVVLPRISPRMIIEQVLES